MNVIITRAFDLFVVIPSCLIYVDQRRFENYGGLGQYRDTSYGLECRSLGGYFANPKYTSWIFDQVNKAIEFINNEENFYKLNYMAKPNVTFKDNKFIFDSSVYDKLNIVFDEQLIITKKAIYV